MFLGTFFWVGPFFSYFRRLGVGYIPFVHRDLNKYRPNILRFTCQISPVHSSIYLIYGTITSNYNRPTLSRRLFPPVFPSPNVYQFMPHTQCFSFMNIDNRHTRNQQQKSPVVKTYETCSFRLTQN